MYTCYHVMSECPDGMCPVRHAIIKLGGGVQPNDNSALVRGGGVMPCCDIVVDHVRYMHASDTLDIAHGVSVPAETAQQTVTRYMQPVCRVTARMLERCVDMVASAHPLACMDIRTSMVLSALSHNMNEIARAVGVTAPTLETKPWNPPADITKHLDYAGEYARWLEQQHIIACQWMSTVMRL